MMLNLGDGIVLIPLGWECYWFDLLWFKRITSCLLHDIYVLFNLMGLNG